MAAITGGAVQTGRSVVGGVRILGVREAIAALEGAGRVARIWVGLEVHTSAESMAAKARGNIHSISGHLKAGTRAEGFGPYNWNVLSSSRDGGAEKEYAGFVENGTSRMEPRFYMARAFADTKPEVMAHLMAIAAKISAL